MGAYTITFLGTDTHFQPSKAESYEIGETLSIVSQAISGNSIKPENEIIQYQTSNSAVIVGPTTLANFRASSWWDAISFGSFLRFMMRWLGEQTELDNHMQVALRLVVKAFSDGKSTINLIGHSRGAVLSMVFVQYLTGLKNAVELNLSLPEGIVLPEKAKEYMLNMKVNIFALDPVPGGAPLKLPVKSFTLNRLKTSGVLPSIVGHYIQYTCMHERSSYFAAFTPRTNQSPDVTRFEHYTIPGHHGTPSGNFFTQGGETEIYGREINVEATSAVSKFMVLKLIQFLSSHEVNFQLSQSLIKLFPQSWVSWLCSFLLTTWPATGTNDEYNKELLRLYEIMLNFSGSYTPLTHVYYHKSNPHFKFYRTTLDDRKIKSVGTDGNVNKTWLKEVCPPPGQAINQEHLRLRSEHS